MDLSRAQRNVLIVAGLVLVVAVALGFWPLSITLADGTSYSCGSGFVHSRHSWTVDTRTLVPAEQLVAGSTATPESACPTAVYGRRDLSFLVAGVAVFGGLVGVGVAPSDPLFRSSRRRHRRKPTRPIVRGSHH
jgi:disulfide bond formation protein DsbB